MEIKRYLEQDKKLLVKVIAGVLLLVIAFVFYLIKNSGGEEELALSQIPQAELEASLNPEKDATTSGAVEERLMILVDVAGAVTSPSVVELPEGSRVCDAVKKAGGLTEDADTRYTNQAEFLTDGQKLYIPTRQELTESDQGAPGTGFSYSSGANSPVSPSSGLININTADSETLQQLSGVGPATAEKIILYRNENGKFNSIEEITNVSGIGNKTFEKFKDKITVK